MTKKSSKTKTKTAAPTDGEAPKKAKQLGLPGVLIELVKKHGLKNYVYEDEDGEEFAVEYSEAQKETVKVRKVDRREDEE